MARRRKGVDIDGWLIVDKPEGVTSTQVVGRARWAFDARKAGHAGTLDPLATGLLAVAFGEATKTVPFAQDGLKTYRFTARWGVSTTTDDREGEVLEESTQRPSRDEIEAVLPAFTGVIRQRPPAFSAIKVRGERAYDLARRGDAPVLAERPIAISRLTLLDAPDPDHAVFEMVCGKGGYVRSLARDLGAALGGCAHVAALRRTASGAFDLSAAATWDGLQTLGEGDPAARAARLAPTEASLAGVPRVDIDAKTAERLANGDASGVAGGAATGGVFWAAHRGEVVAVLERSPTGRISIRRGFSFTAA